MKKFFLLAFTVAAVIFLGAQSDLNFNGDANEFADVKTEKPLKKSDAANWWETETLTVEGHGKARADEKNIGQARILAKRAALMDGYRNLAKATGQVQITAKDTLSEEKIDVLIKGATILSETYDANGNCTVVLSVPIYGVTNSFAKAALEPVDKKNFPAPKSEVAAKGNYTGLIIDCGDLELNPVLAPELRDEKNQSVYGYENLDYEKVIAKGMIGYVEKRRINFSDEEIVRLLKSGGTKNHFAQVGSKIFFAAADGNLTRAGSNPLIIKATGLSEDNSCPVISEEDADKILSENLSSHFLDEGAVVFTSNRIRGMRM